MHFMLQHVAVMFVCRKYAVPQLGESIEVFSLILWEIMIKANISNQIKTLNILQEYRMQIFYMSKYL